MPVPFIPTRNATPGSNAAPTTAALTNTGQMAINAYTGAMYMRKEDSTISDIVASRLSGFRNRIINGGMRIDQRNSGASFTVTGPNFTLDRWEGNCSVASKFTVQQVASTLTGFSNALQATSIAATSLNAGDYYLINQSIEGNNVADLAWGTANAQPVTLSFWVRSSLTGTFGGSIRNSAANRSYPFTYTISAANTWEFKEITVLGDTSGTWLTNILTGIRIFFGLGVGSTFSGSAGSWASANYFSATGATSVVGTNGATLSITGVQFEKGLVATPFETRSFGTEFDLCSRYFQAFIAPAMSRIPIRIYAPYITSIGNPGLASYLWPVQMRADPTVSIIGTWTQSNCTGPTIGLATKFGLEIYATSTVSGNIIDCYALQGTGLIVSAEL